VDFGIFAGPYSIAYMNGQRAATEVIAWDLQQASWVDEYGLAEMLFAEHYTIGYEPSPAPEMMIAAAAQATDRIRLGAAGNLLPYHNPANLAHRLMWLDHMTGGRLIAGFAPGSYPTDMQLFGTANRNSEMFVEGLDIIEAIWTREPPFRIEGKYWTVDMPEYTEQWGGPHLKPFQRPRPEVILTGMQPKSPTFAEAGKRGYSPLSQQLSVGTLRQHWEHYAEVASEHGQSPDRANWRILRDILVADTDEEARRLAVESTFGDTWRTCILPAFKTIRARPGAAKPYALGQLILDPGMDIEELTIDWMADNFWLVGSPETVAEKVAKLDEDLGGVGCILSLTFDYSDDPEPWRRSLELIATEVMPRVAEIGARAGTTVS
jgi:alkanesulfonate monooxygenase SsuD/methylene tetrahydromethanopterin reductase-like flavin-dependent oxidoreductase (luciferase family)